MAQVLRVSSQNVACWVCGEYQVISHEPVNFSSLHNTVVRDVSPVGAADVLMLLGNTRSKSSRMDSHASMADFESTPRVQMKLRSDEARVRRRAECARGWSAGRWGRS